MLPRKARSELMNASPRAESKTAGLGVYDTSRMFLMAMPAVFFSPAASPTRGSFMVATVSCCCASSAIRAMAAMFIAVLSKSVEHLLHYENFVALVGIDVGGKTEDVGVLPCARRREQLFHHL